MPTTILASRYNDLRNDVNLVLSQSGASTPTFGYGESTTTNNVAGTRTVSPPSNADKVTAQDYEDLYIDVIRCRAHQIGATNVTIDDFVIGDYDSNPATADTIEEAYILGLETLAADVQTDRFLVDSSNLRLTNVPSANSTRPAAGNIAWNGIITHIFTMTFSNELERRHFFNAGGQIRLSASVDYTGSQAKTVDWQSILNDMGTISFKATETINNASPVVGTGSSIGNYDLNSGYQLIYSRTGGAAYARNEYRIYAQNSATLDGTSQIKFKVEFADGQPNDPSYGIDEVVFGTFNSTVQTATPDGEVIIAGTTYATVLIEDDPVGAIIRALS